MTSLGTLALTTALTAVAATAALAEDPVKIGMITTLSGPAGYIGEQMRDGFMLAIEEGMLGGVEVEVLVEDDQLNPGHGRQIADAMVYDEEVRIMTGIIFSNVAGAVVPDVVSNDVIYVSPNAGPSTLARGGLPPELFRRLVAERHPARGARHAGHQEGIRDGLPDGPQLPGGQGCAGGLHARLRG